jgi:hypothetical protein
MDEVEEQLELAQRFEAAIAAMEPFVVQTEDGQISFGDADLSALDIDTDVLDSLMASVADLNTALAFGAIAINDVEGVAHG